MIYKLLHQAENKWLQVLHDHVKTEFKKIWLPSHDETHHYRVWQYCKEFVTLLNNNGCHFSKQKTEQLIIAAFFHDLGLTRTVDSSHGAASSDLCVHFLSKYENIGDDFIKPILNAIERHDDKSYINLTDSLADKTDLHPVLALCDDLDAFGPVGIYRYIEIYHRRRVQMHEMPAQIIENLKNRFSHLLWFCGEMDNFTHMHKKRFQYTLGYFESLSEQLKSEKNTNEGPIGVYNLIINQTQNKHIHFTRLPAILNNKLPDAYCKCYLNDLQEELNKFT